MHFSTFAEKEKLYFCEDSEKLGFRRSSSNHVGAIKIREITYVRATKDEGKIKVGKEATKIVTASRLVRGASYIFIQDICGVVGV